MGNSIECFIGVSKLLGKVSKIMYSCENYCFIVTYCFNIFFHRNSALLKPPLNTVLPTSSIQVRTRTKRVKVIIHKWRRFKKIYFNFHTGKVLHVVVPTQVQR